MDKELLDAMEQLLDRKLAPVLAVQKQLLGKVDYLSGVVEESLALHDELEQRVKALEEKAM